MKKHLKRLTIPKSWPIKKKGIVFTIKPNPGPHSIKLGISIGLLMRDIMGVANNSKEVKKILHDTEVLVDGIRRKDIKFPLGIMDVMEFKKSKEYFRIILEKRKISTLSIDKKEAEIKPCRITGKSTLKGKIQLNLYDGKNIIVEKDTYKVGDTIVIGLPKQDIKEHIKLEKGCSIYLIGGKHTGDIGKIEDISLNKITYKQEGGEIIETLKKYVFVIGKDKPVISLAKKE
jgi:small subunit ribosomal protein S4e